MKLVAFSTLDHVRYVYNVTELDVTPLSLEVCVAACLNDVEGRCDFVYGGWPECYFGDMERTETELLPGLGVGVKTIVLLRSK